MYETHAGKHVRYGAGNLDTQQSCHAKKESKEASRHASPKEDIPLPCLTMHQHPERLRLSL